MRKSVIYNLDITEVIVMGRKKDNWFGQLYNFNNKERSTNNYIKYMLLRTQSMFKYNGLPDTIPQKYLELFLQMNGHCAIVSVNGLLYAVEGGYGGTPDPYYIPTEYIVANPALELTKTYTIDSDCVIMQNDILNLGLYPLMLKYSTALTENDISMRMVSINARIQSLISAGDDRTKKEADAFIKGIEDGKLSAVFESQFLDGIRTQPYGNTGNSNLITNLIEYHQYQKASFFNDLGLNANYNMKRESLNSNESQLNDDMLKPLIDEMLETRRECLEKVNNMYGTNITVDLSSVWKENEQEHDAELDILESQAEKEDNEDEQSQGDVSELDE